MSAMPSARKGRPVARPHWQRQPFDVVLAENHEDIISYSYFTMIAMPDVLQWMLDQFGFLPSVHSPAFETQSF